MTAAIAYRLRDWLDRTFGRKIGRASVFGLMRDPVVLLDARDAIVDVNPAFERRLTDAVAKAPSGDRSARAPASDAAARLTDGGSPRRLRHPAPGRAVGDALPALA
ncbi:MAG: PAS domain-containing protein, partial [Trueperaceae bacterium]|nr:PAS domain-containing protein [Trueperaceae bacterium]